MPSQWGDQIPNRLVEYWQQLLPEFDQKLYPYFQSHGYTKGVALQAFILDQIDSSLTQLVELLQDNWRGK